MINKPSNPYLPYVLSRADSISVVSDHLSTVINLVIIRTYFLASLSLAVVANKGKNNYTFYESISLH